MIDRFLLIHGTLRWNTTFPYLNNRTFTHAKLLCQYTLDPDQLPGKELVEGTSDARDHERLFQLICNNQLNPYEMDGPLSRLLYECILLTKIQSAYLRQRESFIEDLPYMCAGGMVQQKLAQLLLQVNARQRRSIFHIGTYEEMDQHLWESAFIGSASFVRVLKAASEIPGVRIIPSNLLEDVGYGIDVFLENPEGNVLCVSVKTDPSINRSMEGLLIIEEPQPTEDIPMLEALQIYRGVDRFTRLVLLQQKLIPCLIYVGKKPGRIYDLESYPEDIACLLELTSPIFHCENEVAA